MGAVSSSLHYGADWIRAQGSAFAASDREREQRQNRRQRRQRQRARRAARFRRRQDIEARGEEYFSDESVDGDYDSLDDDDDMDDDSDTLNHDRDYDDNDDTFLDAEEVDSVPGKGVYDNHPLYFGPAFHPSSLSGFILPSAIPGLGSIAANSGHQNTGVDGSSSPADARAHMSIAESVQDQLYRNSNLYNLISGLNVNPLLTEVQRAGTLDLSALEQELDDVEGGWMDIDDEEDDSVVDCLAPMFHLCIPVFLATDYALAYCTCMQRQPQEKHSPTRQELCYLQRSFGPFPVPYAPQLSP
ncbi:hypothetical protein BCR41DRAFT_372377 [Lobosporangium transversale]|uniref:Uncharacterized protein n=1 Tax=Lobosporangium transversale TaxID=64571 RepID=A0A1Y2GH22_9FUNG|nr:hypothetical protein BCR41DRAFT_372377 [Lobosporangium transversale]ORZ10639.1 hypothetical protein BCR41DRAFT_372377 [Lobosporangium transversale]|eukprot:XP_021879360.1 hypothetical protein BCR41DRAFT_372377 [Lobosporangium transversale]